MSLDHRDLQDIPRGVCHGQTMLCLHFMDCLFSDDLMGDCLDDLCSVALGLDPEVLGGDIGEMKGVLGFHLFLLNNPGEDFSSFGNQTA